MTPKKRIAVVGATGSQDGGLVRAILADPGRCWCAAEVAVFESVAVSFQRDDFGVVDDVGCVVADSGARAEWR
jgi:hypothetical protein